jgi:hypothetical protein
VGRLACVCVESLENVLRATRCLTVSRCGVTRPFTKLALTRRCGNVDVVWTVRDLVQSTAELFSAIVSCGSWRITVSIRRWSKAGCVEIGCEEGKRVRTMGSIRHIVTSPSERISSSVILRARYIYEHLPRSHSRNSATNLSLHRLGLCA